MVDHDGTRRRAGPIGADPTAPLVGLPFDQATTAAHTRQLLGWTPTRPGLLDDIAAGAYDG